MKVAKPTRKRNWTAAAVAIVMVLAVLVAPVCASVCASKNCDLRIASTAMETSCHHGDAMEHSSGWKAANKKACVGQELPAAALSSRNEQTLIQKLEVQTVTIVFSEPTSSFFSVSQNAFCLSWRDVPLERSEHLSSTVLRI